MPRPLLATLLALVLLLPAACAQSPGGPQSGPGNGSAAAAAAASDPTDPLEPVNRQVHSVNTAIDDCCLRPVAVGYRAVTTPWVRQRVRNVVNNAHEMRHSINALLQGDPILAGSSLMRFVINSTLGIGGMFDLEPVGGPPHQPRDFGQTMHGWGVADGPFLMLPLIGPTNARDLVGRTADGFMNPVSWLMPFWGNITRGAVEGLDLRERNIESLDALRAESLDYYARLRSVWQQRRAAELGRGPEGEAEPRVLDDPEGSVGLPAMSPPASLPAPPPAAPAPDAAPTPSAGGPRAEAPPARNVVRSQVAARGAAAGPRRPSAAPVAGRATAGQVIRQAPAAGSATAPLPHLALSGLERPEALALRGFN